MRINKFYLYKKYDQWKNRELFIEDEDISQGIFIQFVDVEMDRGQINVISADIKDAMGNTYSIGGVIEDYKKRIVKFFMPSGVANHDGKYQIIFTVAYNSNDEGNAKIQKSAIQTFVVLDTIDTDDEVIINESNYPVLLQLIEELSSYKVDTSKFPTFTEVTEMLDQRLEGVSMEIIIQNLENMEYITQKQLDRILRNFLQKSDLANYVTQADFQKVVTWTEFLKYDKNYATLTTLNDYVRKVAGKNLSTNDFTNELSKKLNDIDLSKYYSKEEIKAVFMDRDEINQCLKEIELKGLSQETLNKIEKCIEKDKVYTKEEVDNKFVAKDEIDDISFDDYYNKQYIDNTFVRKEVMDNLDEIYYDKQYIDNEIAKKEDIVETDLSNYYNKQEIDDKFTKKEDVIKVDLSNYYTKQEVDEKYLEVTNISINDETIDKNKVYSSYKTEERLSEISQEITNVDDNLLDMETRVEYLEIQQQKFNIAFTKEGKLQITIGTVTKTFTPDE